ncbi:MAG: hypothetical protein JWM11_7011, partial [Planctomycetaceae bacterium]|nr:hypothetical protein [Planctomycetaceae bacterium]
MTLENNSHIIKRFHSWNRASRIYQSTVRIPWIRLVGACLFAICLTGTSLTLPNSAVAGAPVDLAPMVKAHLDAGEYGPALDLALTATDPEQKAELLKQITATQLENGDSTGARQALQRVPAGKTRDAVSRATQQQMAGGGSFANPQPLMMLIMQLTGGEEAGSPWQQISGEGGAISWSANGVWVD